MTQPTNVNSRSGRRIGICLDDAEWVEIRYHAKRLNKSLSWVIRKCIKVSLAKIKQTVA